MATLVVVVLIVFAVIVGWKCMRKERRCQDAGDGDHEEAECGPHDRSDNHNEIKKNLMMIRVTKKESYLFNFFLFFFKNRVGLHLTNRERDWCV